MRTAVPDGDLATVIDLAVTEKLERLEARRFGKAKAPRKSLDHTNPMRCRAAVAATIEVPRTPPPTSTTTRYRRASIRGQSATCPAAPRGADTSRQRGSAALVRSA